MTDEKRYIITLSQLKELTWSPNKDIRVKLFTEIATSHEYKKMGSLMMIFVGIGDLVAMVGRAIFRFIDEQTAPKKGGKKL